MREGAEAASMKLEETPIEFQGNIRMVERYHAALILAYKRARMDSNGQVSD